MAKSSIYYQLIEQMQAFRKNKHMNKLGESNWVKWNKIMKDQKDGVQ
jgi:hypothetical protein